MPSYGPHTQADLSEIAPLFRADPQRYDRDAGRFALELAATAYTFALSPWLDAGFTDITLQVEKRLYSGIRAGEEATFRQNMRNSYSQMRARQISNAPDSPTLMRGLLRNAWQADSGKALVMLRPADNGRILVAIGFAGTGRKLNDWIPNLRFKEQEGFHGGFYALTRQFMANADKITFPSLGETNGRPVSLADIIEDAKKPDSRYFLFAAGHSQGSAVLQIWLHLMVQAGVQKKNLLGYGFASPSVCTAGVSSPDLPAILIANSDDVVARVGLQKHLGRQYLYPAGRDFFEKCYGSLDKEPLFQSIRGMLNGISGTREALLCVLAHVYAMSYLDEEDAAPTIRAFVPISVLETASQSAQSLICLSRRFVRQNYAGLYGEPDRAELLSLARRYYLMLKNEPNYAPLLVKTLWTAHHLYLPDPLSHLTAAYAYIVVRGYPQLTVVDDPA